MFDFVAMEQRMRESTEPLSPIERELALLMANERAHSQPSMRRRIASMVVGLGLKLDPEALTASRGLTLGTASVHD
jgi:hypothetical protein